MASVIEYWARVMIALDHPRRRAVNTSDVSRALVTGLVDRRYAMQASSDFLQCYCLSCMIVGVLLCRCHFHMRCTARCVALRARDSTSWDSLELADTRWNSLCAVRGERQHNKQYPR